MCGYQHGTPAHPAGPNILQVHEELVFVDPVETFYRRVTSTMPRPAPELSCQPYTSQYDEREELEKLKECRARVAAMVSDVRKDYEGAR